MANNSIDQIMILKDMSRQLQAVAGEISRTAVHSTLGTGANPFNGKKIFEPFEQLYQEMHSLLSAMFAHHGGFAGVHSSEARRKDDMHETETRREAQREERQASRDQMIEERIARRDALREEMALRKQMTYEALRMEKQAKYQESKNAKRDQADLAAKQQAATGKAPVAVPAASALKPPTGAEQTVEAALREGLDIPVAPPALPPHGGSRDPIDEWSEEDLENYAEKIAEEAEATVRLPRTHAQVSESGESILLPDHPLFDKQSQEELNDDPLSFLPEETGKEVAYALRGDKVAHHHLPSQLFEAPESERQPDDPSNIAGKRSLFPTHSDSEGMSYNLPSHHDSSWEDTLDKARKDKEARIPYDFSPDSSWEDALASARKQQADNDPYAPIPLVEPPAPRYGVNPPELPAPSLKQQPPPLPSQQPSPLPPPLPYLSPKGQLEPTGTFDKVTKEQVQETKRSNKAQDYLGQQFVKFGNSLDKMGESSAFVFKQGTSIMGAGVASASPDAFSTLSGSFKLLGAQLSKELLPYIVSASVKVQGLANAFGQLTETSRGVIAESAVMATGFAGLALAIPTIIRMFTGLGAAGPLALAGLAGYALYQTAKVATAENEKKEDDVLDERPKYNFDEVQEGFTAKKLAGMSKEERIEYLQVRRKQLAKNFSENTELINANRPSTGLGNIFNWAVGEDAPYNQALQTQKKLTQENADLQILEAKYIHGQDPRKVINPVLTKKERDAGEKDVFRFNSLLLDIQNRTQPAYFGVDELYKKIQLEALSESPLQQEMRKIQLDQLEALYKASDYLKQLVDKDVVNGLR